MNLSFYRDKVVIITGGSSGIGFAMAKEFAKQKSKIILIARDKIKLETAKMELQNLYKNIQVEFFVTDISDKSQVTSVINEIGNRYRQIDVLINCAGIITCGRFADQPVDDLEKSICINYLGAVYVSKVAWPWLKKAKGQLSFVSSVAGYMGLIGYSSYAPTKFALLGLAECLNMEAEKDGIRISIIYPPDTDTPLLKYERAHTLPESIALSKSIKVVSPEKVAEIYMKGLQKGTFEIYCDFTSRILRSFKTILPGLFSYFTLRVIKKAAHYESKVLNGF